MNDYERFSWMNFFYFSWELKVYLRLELHDGVWKGEYQFTIASSYFVLQWRMKEQIMNWMKKSSIVFKPKLIFRFSIANILSEAVSFGTLSVLHWWRLLLVLAPLSPPPLPPGSPLAESETNTPPEEPQPYGFCLVRHFGHFFWVIVHSGGLWDHFHPSQHK